MELQVGVKILLKNKDNKYLILHRSPKYSEVKGMWDIPGGRIEIGTPLIENLKREILEETKLELPGDPKLFFAQNILRIAGRHVVRLTYIGNIEGEPQLDHEHNEFRWLTIDELKKLEDLDIYLKDALERVPS